MDNNAGSNEMEKDIMEKSAADSSEQQYASIDEVQISTSQKPQQLIEILEVITRVMIRLAMIPGQKTILL